MELPSELTEGASLRGNEYAWAPSAFPHVLASAEALGLACLGAQFQFRTPEATCEMYWLSAGATERLVDEPWSTYVARSSAEVSSAFSALLQSTDFVAEAQCWSDVPELSGAGASPEQYLCVVACFVPERPAPKWALGDHMSGQPRDYVLRCTYILRWSEDSMWARIRSLLEERGLQPSTSILATSFPDDCRFEFCIVVTADRKVFQFGFDYRHKPTKEGVIVEWVDLTDDYLKSHFPDVIYTALEVLDAAT